MYLLDYNTLVFLHTNISWKEISLKSFIEITFFKENVIDATEMLHIFIKKLLLEILYIF